MGQPIVVVEKETPRPGTYRYEANRSLTGMAHERYQAGDEVVGNRPPDELARRLFAHGGVASVHIHSNMVDVELARGGTNVGLAEVVEGLYIYYREGVQPAIP
jgi:hypothetical protein